MSRQRLLVVLLCYSNCISSFLSANGVCSAVRSPHAFYSRFRLPQAFPAHEVVVDHSTRSAPRRWHRRYRRRTIQDRVCCMSTQSGGYTAVLIIPTGVGAAIGGYAGDGLPVAKCVALDCFSIPCI